MAEFRWFESHASSKEKKFASRILRTFRFRYLTSPPRDLHINAQTSLPTFFRGNTKFKALEVFSLTRALKQTAALRHKHARFKGATDTHPSLSNAGNQHPSASPGSFTVVHPMSEIRGSSGPDVACKIEKHHRRRPSHAGGDHKAADEAVSMPP